MPSGKKFIHKNLDRASLGTQKDLNILMLDTTEDLIAFAKEKNLKVICVEQSENSIDLDTVSAVEDCILVFGNEVEGVSPELLEVADETWEIKASGKHNSLNVSTSVGVVLSKIKSGVSKHKNHV